MYQYLALNFDINSSFLWFAEGKWKTNLVEWPWLNYPSYLLGAIALIPGRKIESLLGNMMPLSGKFSAQCISIIPLIL